MKKTRITLIAVSMLLVCCMFFNLTGCTVQSETNDLMAGITPNEIIASDDLSAKNADVTDFALRLFRACEESGENTLISPLSVLCALSMTANGAKGETLEQMQDVLGMTTDELNLYLYSYMKSLPQDEKYKMSLANSIWFTDDESFSVNKDFLQTNADYYSADIYKAPFNRQTRADINGWVNEKTDGMIPEILDELPPEAVMYLVNALTFEAEWQDLYCDYNLQDDVFTTENGKKRNAEFMYGTEGVYLEDEKAIGFMKYYKDGKYAFIALLPNEGVSVSEYVASLDGEALNELLSNSQDITVYSSIPKFETEYDVEMSEILIKMGMTDAFDVNAADFSGLGTSTGGNIFISRVIHKTFITVNENGTKAGAATLVEATYGSTGPADAKRVYLDRPFVYMLVDCENNIPFFVGTLMDVK